MRVLGGLIDLVYGDIGVYVVAAYIQANAPLPPKSPGRVTQP